MYLAGGFSGTVSFGSVTFVNAGFNSNSNFPDAFVAKPTEAGLRHPLDLVGLPVGLYAVRVAVARWRSKSGIITKQDLRSALCLNLS